MSGVFGYVDPEHKITGGPLISKMASLMLHKPWYISESAEDAGGKAALRRAVRPADGWSLHPGDLGPAAENIVMTYIVVLNAFCTPTAAVNLMAEANTLLVKEW
jgi:hypothetical protein